VHRVRSLLAWENDKKLELATSRNDSGLIDQNLLDYWGD
jgi:hypothetical protein